MKMKYLGIIVFTFLLSSVYTQESIELYDLDDYSNINADVIGLSTYRKIKVNLSNNGSSDKKIKISCGTFFENGNTYEQSLVVLFKDRVYLDGNDRSSVELTTACMDASKSSPSSHSNWTIKNGLFDGFSQGWYENGQLEYEWNIKNGFDHGIQKQWYESGQLEYEENYKNGLENGKVKGWYVNGQLEYEENYKNGLENGTLKGWYENGQLEYEWNFKNGIEHGIQKVWNEWAELEYEENYENGELLNNDSLLFIQDSLSLNW